MLTEHGAKLSDVERGTIDRALTEAKDALTGSDLDRIRRTQDELQKASGILAEAMGRQAAASGAGPAGPQGTTAEGGVVEGEVVEEEKT